MSFFQGSFRGKTNAQVLRTQSEAGVKAIEAREAGRRDRDAEALEAAASSEMCSRYTEETRNAEASALISRWIRR